MRGWVYVIKNKAMPDLLKIGFSTKDPILRARDFNGTGVPYDYEVIFDALVDGPQEVERAVHRALQIQKENKEWFRCNLDHAIEEIRRAAGFIYKEQFHSKHSLTQNHNREHYSEKKELGSPESSDWDEIISIGSLKAKALLRLLKNRIDETINAGVEEKLVKSLRFVSLQVEDIIYRDKVYYEEFSSISDELERISFLLDPDKDELFWTLVSTSTLLCENIMAGEFEITDQIQTFLNYAEIVRIKLKEKPTSPPEKKVEAKILKTENIDHKKEAHRRPIGDSKCPSCQYIFRPSEVTEFIDCWMRCPKCRQLMNID